MTGNNGQVDLRQYPDLEAQTEKERTPEIMRSEIEKQIRSLAAGKTPEINSLPQKNPLQDGDEAVND